MKAVQLRRYGAPDILSIEDIPAPTPAPNQAVVRVLASSVNPADWHKLRGEPFLVRLTEGMTRPKDPGIGTDVAGIVESVGADVTNVRPGDQVFGMSIRTWAELVAVRAEGLVAKPANVSFEQAGVVGVAALTALQGLRTHGRVTPGQRVLIAGAGGGVGSFAVQIAKALGADVTAATNAANVEWVRDLGADTVIDYAAADPTAQAGRYDVIFDAGGWLTLFGERRALRDGGTAVNAGAGKNVTLAGIAARIVGAAAISRIGSRRFVSYLAKRTQEDLQILRGMLEEGRIRPHIDRRYTLDQIQGAVAYQETGHAHGKVAVVVAPTAR